MWTNGNPVSIFGLSHYLLTNLLLFCRSSEELVEEMYESDEFQEAMRAEISWLNERLADVSPARFKELTRIFSDATRLEIDFWEMGLKQSD